MISAPVILLGAGGHAKVLLEVLHSSGADIRGVVSPELESQGMTSWRGVDVLGNDDAVLAFAASSVQLVIGIGSLPGGAGNVRVRLYERFVSAGYTFATVIHPFTAVSPDAKLSSGVQVMAGSVIQADTTIGDNSIINSRSSIDHDCVIGKHCHIAPGVTICGGVTVGDGVHVGTGANVIQGITLGENCIIGAGITVRRNVPAGMKFLGTKNGSESIGKKL